MTPHRKLGQNFLIDLNLLDLLVRASGIDEQDVVLEVGAGTGGLTTRLAGRAGRVVSVEIDPGFFRLVSRANHRLCESGAACTPMPSSPSTGSARKCWPLSKTPCKRSAPDHYHVVANLPYDVANPGQLATCCSKSCQFAR